MQKSDIARGLEEAPEQKSSGLQKDIRGMEERNLISTVLRRRTAARTNPPLPPIQEINEHIDNLFAMLKDSQPSRAFNAGAGISDSTFAMLLADRGNILLGLGVLATELVALVKNSNDGRYFNKARKNALKELEGDSSKIVSKLEHALSAANGREREKEIGGLIKETKELFSEIKSGSKQGLTGVAGSRLEGIAGSIPGVLASIHPASPYKHFIDGVSAWASGLIHGFPLQIPPWIYADMASAVADVAIRGIAYIAASSVFTYAIDWVIQKAHRDRSFENRENARELLKLEAGKLLDKISTRCG